MTDRLRLEAVVHGRVQGVGFRYFVLHRAAALALEGWVANDTDGSVRCRAEGARQALDELVAALRSGPPGARVSEVRTAWSPATGGLGPFTVRSGAHPGD